MFERPVVDPRTQMRKSPLLQELVGAVVYWFGTVLPNGPSLNSRGPLINGTPSPSVLYVSPGGLWP